MRILVQCPLHPSLVKSGLGAEVIYRPNLARSPESARRQAEQELQPDGILVAPGCADPRPDSGSRRPLIELAPTSPPADLQADLQALARLERRIVERQAHAELDGQGIEEESCEGAQGADLQGHSVWLVGAGIVNLVVAQQLLTQGAQVRMVDAGPDPRRAASRHRLGATHSGGNARTYCSTETGSYNRRLAGQGFEPGSWNRTVEDQGRSLLAVEALIPAERDWISSFDRLASWRAEVFHSDVQRFNLKSGLLWQQLQQAHPALFQDVGWTPNVLRVYSQPEPWLNSQRTHQDLGTLRQVYAPASLARRHPGLAPAIDAREIAGGLEIQGFTVQIHDLAAKLLAQIEILGGQLHWNTRVHTIEKDSAGRVTGLRTDQGLLRARHYVVSPGAAPFGVAGLDGGGRPTLLQNSLSEQKIQGVAGLWMTLPNSEPTLAQSLKIRREGTVGEDSNVTVGRDRQGRPALVMGSGYGFVGQRPVPKLDHPQVTAMYQQLEDTAQRFLPRPFSQAMKQGGEIGRAGCVRPFTSTGLGIFETMAGADDGFLVIAAGHNTGGFTQAPLVAEAVSATFAKQRHPMQILFHPLRGWGSSQA